MRAMSSPEIMHASVMSAFPAFDMDSGRILWRLDTLGESTYVLIQSQTKPDLTHMVEQFGWPASGQRWETVDYEGFLEGIAAGDVRRFRLVANPVRSLPSGQHGERGKVCHHITSEQQLSWLTSKALRLGVTFDRESDPRCYAEVVSRELQRFDHKGSEITLSRVGFQGILRVEDPDMLRASMVNGIGRAKAYGCGMLSLSRVLDVRYPNRPQEQAGTAPHKGPDIVPLPGALHGWQER